MEKQLQVWAQNEEITCQIQKCRIISNNISISKQKVDPDQAALTCTRPV